MRNTVICLLFLLTACGWAEEAKVSLCPTVVLSGAYRGYDVSVYVTNNEVSDVSMRARDDVGVQPRHVWGLRNEAGFYRLNITPNRDACGLHWTTKKMGVWIPSLSGICSFGSSSAFTSPQVDETVHLLEVATAKIRKNPQKTEHVDRLCSLTKH